MNLKDNKLATVAVALILLSPLTKIYSQVCTEPVPVTECTPPTVWDKDVVASGSAEWNSLGLGSSANVTQKIRIFGTGTVIVPNGDLILKSGSAVLFIDGPTLVVKNGNLK